MDAATSRIIADLQQRLRIFEDKDALNTLLNTYCRAADTADTALFASTFTLDGSLLSDAFDTITGRDNVAAAIATGKRFAGLMHSVSNIELEVDGSDTAAGHALLSFYATPDKENLGDTFAFGGRYRFQFRREADIGGEKKWKISAVGIERVWEQGEDRTGMFRRKS